MKKKVMDILKNRSEPTSSVDISTDLKQLKSEKWTSATTAKKYINDVKNVIATIEKKS